MTRSGAREKILMAADDIARDVGPANLAIEAVAARAGVSKGGLLYHFPTKLDLLNALVGRHLSDFEAELTAGAASRGQSASALLAAYVDVSFAECERKAPPASGVLAAMVQNPEILDPIRRFKRDILDRLMASPVDPASAMVVYLALEGLRSQKLFDLQILRDDEIRLALDALVGLVAKADGEGIPAKA